VIHHIEVCSYPNWIANAQVRLARLDGHLLTLSAKPMTFQGVEQRAALTWERVGYDWPWTIPPDVSDSADLRA
jgi:hypothetical protein